MVFLQKILTRDPSTHPSAKRAMTRKNETENTHPPTRASPCRGSTTSARGPPHYEKLTEIWTFRRILQRAHHRFFVHDTCRFLFSKAKMSTRPTHHRGNHLRSTPTQPNVGQGLRLQKHFTQAWRHNSHSYRLFRPPSPTDWLPGATTNFAPTETPSRRMTQSPHLEFRQTRHENRKPPALFARPPWEDGSPDVNGDKK